MAGILLIILMGIQLVQNYSEGMICGKKSPSKGGKNPHQPMYMQQIDNWLSDWFSKFLIDWLSDLLILLGIES